MLDFSKLRGRIKEKNYSEKEFANLIGMAAPTFSGKLKGITFFNTEEIKKAVKVLDIQKEDIYSYFFEEKTE
ncbi:MAG: DUF739 family protein [Clostridia bacterium]|jgi:transcriptional regulator with XRE-family HTH domain|nr:DUF739 family protein [Clostridia bacterium]